MINEIIKILSRKVSIVCRSTVAHPLSLLNWSVEILNTKDLKLGCCNWCSLSLDASERISEKLLVVHSKGRRRIFQACRCLMRWLKIAMMSQPRWTTLILFPYHQLIRLLEFFHWTFLEESVDIEENRLFLIINSKSKTNKQKMKYEFPIFNFPAFSNILLSTSACYYHKG